MKNNKFTTKIKDFISKLTFKDYLIMLITLLCIGLYFGYKHYYNKSLTPVVITNTDSLTIYKNKLKEEYLSKQIYVQNASDLKKQNTDLANELKKLKDNPIVITKTSMQVKIDTIFAKSDTIIKRDSIYNLAWHATEPNDYYHISGETNVHNDFSKFNTKINTVQLNTQLTLNVIDDKKNKSLRIIGKTDNPYINITNMDGVVFDPTKSDILKKYYKPKKWSIGPQVGVGLTGDLKFRPYIGVGISYGIIQF